MSRKWKGVSIEKTVTIYTTLPHAARVSLPLPIMFLYNAIPLIREYSIKTAIALFLFVLMYVYRAARRPVIITGSAYLGFVYFFPICRFLLSTIKGFAMSAFYLHYSLMGIGYIAMFLSNVFQVDLTRQF